MKEDQRQHPVHCTQPCLRRLDGYCGAVSLDDGEVAETQWMQLGELRAHAEQHPEQYTQVGAVRPVGRAGRRRRPRTCSEVPRWLHPSVHPILPLPYPAPNGPDPPPTAQWFLDEACSLAWFGAAAAAGVADGPGVPQPAAGQERQLAAGPPQQQELVGAAT